MNKEEIKNILIDFICEYDFTSYNNDKVYDKFADIILDKVNKNMPDTIIMAGRQNGKTRMIEVKINQILNSRAIEQLEKVLALIQNAVNLESPEYDLVGLYDAVNNQIKQLKEGK